MNQVWCALIRNYKYVYNIGGDDMSEHYEGYIHEVHCIMLILYAGDFAAVKCL